MSRTRSARRKAAADERKREVAAARKEAAANGSERKLQQERDAKKKQEEQSINRKNALRHKWGLQGVLGFTIIWVMASTFFFLLLLFSRHLIYIPGATFIAILMGLIMACVVFKTGRLDIFSKTSETDWRPFWF